MFVDLLSGTGSMAKAAISSGQWHEVLAVEYLAKFRPTDSSYKFMQLDLRSLAARLQVEQIIADHLAKGRLVYVHLSPPCQKFSRANLVYSQEDMDLGLDLLENAIKVAST